MRKVLLLLLAATVLTAVAFSATVYVYPAVTLESEKVFPIAIRTGKDIPAFTTITEADGYVFYAIIDNSGTAHLYRYDIETGQAAHTIIGADVSMIQGIDAGCGYVFVSYFGSQGPEFKVYRYDLTLANHEVCLPAKNLYEGGEKYGAVVCAPPGKYSPRTTDLLPIAVTTKLIGCADDVAYYGIGITSHSTVGSSYYVAVGYTYTRTDVDAQVIGVHPVLTVDGDASQTIPLFAYIPKNPTDVFNLERGLVGVYVYDESPGVPREREIMIRFDTTSDILRTTLDDGTEVVTPYFEEHPPVEFPSEEYGPHIVIPSIVYDHRSGEVYVFGYDQSDDKVVLYRWSWDTSYLDPVLKVDPFEYNMVFYSLYSQHSTAAGEWSMCKFGPELTILFPAKEGSENYYYIAKYFIDSNEMFVMRKIHVPADVFPESVPATMKCDGGKYYVLMTSRKDVLYGPTRKVFADFWVEIDPPYFQEPPGSTVQANIKGTVSATLVEVNSPSYIVVDAPNTVSQSPQTITFEVSPSAPEDEYGIITLTYQTQDGAKFKSGVLYYTRQVNDPPTTPQITGVDIENGVATIYWEESYDPDGDPITYIVKVYDDTDMVVVFEENVSTTSVSVPVTVEHTYTVSVIATDGNLMSDTATYQFTYQLQMAVTLIDPKSGTYVVGIVPCRVRYTTNVGATLSIEVSYDGASWNPIEQMNVSGSGEHATSIDLQPGTNYIRAKLSYGVDEVVSDIATIYYDTNSTHVLTIVEPADGATYEVAPNAQLEVTFTAVFDTSADTGTRTYKILVTDMNGNTHTVASVTTDEPAYTLQGMFGLPAGEYVAYPVYVNPFGSEVFGTSVSFTIVESESPNNPPSIPVLYEVQDTTETNVWLMWHESVDPEGDPITYHIIVATDDGFTNIVLDTTTTETELLATGLYGGNVYYWKVQACDSSGLCSAWSLPSSFVVFESTTINIDDPSDGGAYVADETNVAKIRVRVHAFTNTNKQFEMNVLYNGGIIDNQVLAGPFDQVFEYNVELPPGEYNIVATLQDMDTNEVYITSSSITIYEYGSETPPTIHLIDPPDGYFEEIDPMVGHTTITARANFELVKEGDNYIAIEYKLKWAATWNTLIDSTIAVTPENNTATLTQNVELGEGVYLFRAKVVDPDGVVWYSDTHSVVLRLAETTPPRPDEGEGGGGGGGGGGAAPILVPEKVVWEVGSDETTIRTITVENVGKNPIKVKLWYEGEIAAYILAPPDESSIVIPPGEFNISFKVSGKGQPVGTIAEGKIVLAPTGTTIEIPVELHIVEGAVGPGVDVTSLVVPIVVVGALVVLYLIYTGVI